MILIYTMVRYGDILKKPSNFNKRIPFDDTSRNCIRLSGTVLQMHFQSLIPVQQSGLVPSKVINRPNRVYPFTERNTSIDASLGNSLLPLWKITSYSFVLLGWYKKLPESNRLITLLRYLWIALYLSLMVLVTVFFLYQLELEVVNTESTTQSILPYLMWFCNYPLYLTSAFTFLTRRKELLILFRDWMQMEQQLLHPPAVNNQQRKDYRRLYFCVYALYACHGISTLSGTASILITQPDAPFLLSHYRIIRETLTLPGTMVLQLITFVIGWIFVLLADLVPAWTFYHAGLALQSIENHIEVLRPSSIQRIRFHYEMVSRLVEKVNQIFGGLIVLDHMTLFSMICALLYNILKTFRDPNADTVRFSIGFVFFVLRLTVPILMASHLHTSSFKLRAALSAAITNEAIVMNSEESSHRSILLLNWMNQNPLAARPLNLYNIHPTILMTMTSLVISYVIVLLQSK